MSIDIFSEGSCFNFEENRIQPNHSVMVGKRCAWCMDCGKILIFYEKKEDFKKLMNPFGTEYDD